MAICCKDTVSIPTCVHTRCANTAHFVPIDIAANAVSLIDNFSKLETDSTSETLKQ
jgi:hypothetical protein